RRIKAHITVSCGALTMMDKLDAADFGIAEQTVIPIAEHQHIEALGLKIFFVVQFQASIFGVRGGNNSQRQCYRQSAETAQRMSKLHGDLQIFIDRTYSLSAHK